MSSLQIGATLFVSMLILMSLRVPLSASMFIPGAIGYWLGSRLYGRWHRVCS